MDSSQSSNSQAKTTQSHILDVNTLSTIPHFDFVLPSYTRDRRLSSIASTVIPEEIVNSITASASFSSIEPNPSSPETENERKG